MAPRAGVLRTLKRLGFDGVWGALRVLVFVSGLALLMT